jgi:hypothetical protein
MTAPSSAIPSHWSNTPVPDVSGGNVAPFDTASCGPEPPYNPLPDEDNAGVGTYYVGCAEGAFPQTSISYTGRLIEFVLRCDANGLAALTLDPVYTFVVEETTFDSKLDHAHNAMVTCGSGTGDADSDGMPDTYETAHVCLNANVADASGDPDTDNLMSFDEYTLGTDPCVNDTDTDGCADGEERGPAATSGGQRNPLAHWDFYDVNNSKKVDSTDIALVRSKFTGSNPTPPADQKYDRSNGSAIWAPGPPDNKINALDIGLVRAEFGHSCVAPP